jgi:hypothetical protein
VHKFYKKAKRLAFWGTIFSLTHLVTLIAAAENWFQLISGEKNENGLIKRKKPNP